VIRPEYVELLKQHRADNNPEWGGSAVRNAGDHIVRWLNRRKDIVSVLDFGCGVGTLKPYVKRLTARLDLEWHEYDPSVPGKDVEPTRTFDAIITTDVLEHIELCSLDETLRWIREHATRAQFHHIDCNDNKSLLPDGRSVHLIVEPMEWWLDELEIPGWTLMYYANIMQRKRSRERHSGTIVLDRCA